MAFNIFQTGKGVLKKIETDRAGDETVTESIDVAVDPDISWKRTFSNTGEEFVGGYTVIEADIDTSHRKWKLEYEGTDFSIETIDPKHHIGSGKRSHLEVILR